MTDVSTIPSYSADKGYTGSAGGSTGIAFDFSPLLDRIAKSLDTIATNSTTIATNTTNISNTLTNIKLDVDIITKLAEGAKDLIISISASGNSGQKIIATSDTSSIEVGYLVTGTGIPDNTFVTEVTNTTVKLSQNLTTAASGQYKFYKSWVGIHTLGPYEWLNHASSYHLYIEQGKLVKDSKVVTTILADNLELSSNNVSGQNIITTSSSTNYVAVGQLITGTGIPDSTYVSLVASNSITLTNDLTEDAIGTYNFYTTSSQTDQSTALASLKEYLYKIKSLPTVF
jgi:hypothetical protein